MRSSSAIYFEANFRALPFKGFLFFMSKLPYAFFACHSVNGNEYLSALGTLDGFGHFGAFAANAKHDVSQVFDSFACAFGDDFQEV